MLQTMKTELDQFWLCANSILGLHHIDEIMVMKTMVEMTKCYFKCTCIALRDILEEGGKYSSMTLMAELNIITCFTNIELI